MMQIPFTLHSKSGKTEQKALLDSDATENFMDNEAFRTLGLEKQKLERPRPVFNVDGTCNKAGEITHYCKLEISKDQKPVT